MTGTLRPLVQLVKRPIKDLFWSLRGRSFVNPPIDSEVRSVLFVCLGNICRSPFAEAVASRSSIVRSASAGLRAHADAQVPVDARHAAQSYGISLAAHRPQPLTRDLIDSHDLIVVMEFWQLDAVRALKPDASQRVILLPLFDETAGGHARYHIPDPFQRSRDQFLDCYQRIDHTVTALLAAIERARARSADGSRVRRGAILV